AILGGLAFTIPYAITGVFLGPEFPSLVGALVGLPIIVYCAKKKFLLPRDRWDFPDRAHWQSRWIGKMTVQESKRQKERYPSLFKAWIPYFILAILLALSRVSHFQVGEFLKTFEISFSSIFSSDISVSSTPLYLPGTFLILAGLIVIVVHRMKFPEIKSAAATSAKVLFSAGFVLIFTVPMVRIYINSGINESGLLSM